MLVDSERAERVSPASFKLRNMGIAAIFAFDAPDRVPKWQGILAWSETLKSCPYNPNSVLNADPNIDPDENGIVMFTSGTYVGFLCCLKSN